MRNGNLMAVCTCQKRLNVFLSLGLVFVHLVARYVGLFEQFFLPASNDSQGVEIAHQTGRVQFLQNSSDLLGWFTEAHQKRNKEFEYASITIQSASVFSSLCYLKPAHNFPMELLVVSRDSEFGTDVASAQHLFSSWLLQFR